MNQTYFNTVWSYDKQLYQWGYNTKHVHINPIALSYKLLEAHKTTILYCEEQYKHVSMLVKTDKFPYNVQNVKIFLVRQSAKKHKHDYTMTP